MRFGGGGLKREEGVVVKLFFRIVGERKDLGNGGDSEVILGIIGGSWVGKYLFWGRVFF